MKVIDLTEEHKELYFVCLEDWSKELPEAGDHKQIWYDTMKEKGLRVKLALDDAGNVGGMIQYAPVERSWLEGHGLYFIYCIWVHGHKQGRGNFQKRGMGKALLRPPRRTPSPLELREWPLGEWPSRSSCGRPGSGNTGTKKRTSSVCRSFFGSLLSMMPSLLNGSGKKRGRKRLPIE